jgi:CubicO group peptidase (beta-lactamase class C family)
MTGLARSGIVPRRLVRRAGGLVGAVALAVAATGAHAKDAKPKAPPRKADAALAAVLARAVDDASGGKFWGTVLVAKDGEVVFEKGWGASDRGGKRPNDAETIFELASASKQVTATAILRLEQQKKLKTSDRLTKFFPKAPKDKGAVTLDHLLHHTAGLDPQLGVPYGWAGSRDQYTQDMLAKPLVEKPGETWAYSNVGYALLAAVVEEVTGGTFEAYCRKELFAPAGLMATGFVNDEDRKEDPRATFRECKDGLPGATATKWFWGWGYRGMGGVVTTANDLVRWDRALRGDKILGNPAKEKLYTPTLEKYACGWLVDVTPQGKRAFHAGSVCGFRIQVARWLDEDVLVVVLSGDTADPYTVESTVAERFFAHDGKK